MTHVKDPAAQPILDDTMKAFQLDSHHLRGRMVKLHDVSNTIVHYHAYHPVVASVLGEALALTAGLAGFLDFEGVFTLQTTSKGAVSMLICDITHDGGLRGYAKVDEEKLRATLKACPDGRPTIPQLLGEGYLAFTVQQQGSHERYQGIVALEGDTLAACIEQYFAQSEQIKTHIRLACGLSADKHKHDHWRAAALIVQQMPKVAPTSHIKLFSTDDPEDGWRRVGMLLDTCTAEEMLDSALSADMLLYRLFHEEDVRVYDDHPLSVHCRCSAQKIQSILASLPNTEVMDLMDNGVVTVTCEFCNKDFIYTEQDLLKLAKGNDNDA